MKNFFRNEKGQGLVEYVLIISLIAILLLVSLTFLKNKAGNSYNNTAKYLGTGS